MPNVGLDDVVVVSRAYDRYKDFYRPSVVESKLIARNGADDTFSMQLMNKALFLKTAVDADYQATNVRLDDRRFYSISRTTRVQEIEELGQRGEHRMPEGQGGGYIWQLFSIARFEQRDGGVYVELEAVALSRDIPAIGKSRKERSLGAGIREFREEHHQQRYREQGHQQRWRPRQLSLLLQRTQRC